MPKYLILSKASFYLITISLVLSNLFPTKNEIYYPSFGNVNTSDKSFTQSFTLLNESLLLKSNTIITPFAPLYIYLY